MEKAQHGGDIYSRTIEQDFSVNLNPMDCMEIAEEIIKLSSSCISKYPDASQRSFTDAVSKIENVRPEQVWGGNGASEIIMSTVRMVNPKKVLLVTPCFYGYKHALNALDECAVVTYKNREENGFRTDKKFLDELNKQGSKGLDLLILTNPNNPTGESIDKDMMLGILHICMDKKIKLLVDECFIRMSCNAYSMTKHVDEYDGLFVVNAFTKLFSLPGIRSGYLVSDDKNINRIKKYLPEWNLSIFAQSSAGVFEKNLNNTDFESRTLKLIEKEKKHMCDEMQKMGLTVFDSDAPFILFKSDDFTLKEKLERKKILIRDCSNFEGLSNGYYRIGIKTEDENNILLNAVKEVILNGT